MKFKVSLTTATALGLLMCSAFAGDNNLTNTMQYGDRNSLLVEQDGSNNVAGQGSQFGVPNQSGSRLYQGQYPSNPITGNDNTMEVRQTGDYNRVGLTESGSTNGSYVGQLRNQNVLVVNQTTDEGGAFATNGNTVQRILQNSATAAQVPNNTNGTNILNLTQTNGAAGGFATHYFGQVGQTFSVRNGQPNTVDVLQEGSQSAAAPRTGNKINFLNQSGAGNDVDIVQKGEGLGGLGANNVIHQIGQSGTGHVADINQDGAGNYVRYITQNGGDTNSATISLTGDGNGAASAGGQGSFTTGRGAAAVNLQSNYVSGVLQQGTDNQVDYVVNGGDSNQFGFEQRGTGNLAVDILITGNSNELAVYQNGTSNTLELSSIAGDDNIIGLRQLGTDNVASVDVSGDRNVGYDSFRASETAGALASAQGLVPGLLTQDGIGNDLSLTVGGGNDNVFASLQRGNDNTVVATQTGASNQAAVAQIGNGNVANMSQLGSSNSMSINQ